MRSLIYPSCEEIVRSGMLGRAITVGKHREQLVLIPYEQSENTITPITIHTTTRQQIQFRLKTGQFIINV